MRPALVAPFVALALALPACMLTEDLSDVKLRVRTDVQQEQDQTQPDLDGHEVDGLTPDLDTDTPTELDLDSDGEPDAELDLDSAGELDSGDGELDLEDADQEVDADDADGDAETNDGADEAEVVTPGRVSDGLVFLYTFSERAGNQVANIVGETTGDTRLDLVGNGDLPWLGTRNGIAFNATPPLTARDSAALYEIHASWTSMTLEFWGRADSTSNVCTNSCRIVTAAHDTGTHNFTLGHLDDMLRVRFTNSAGVQERNDVGAFDGALHHFVVVWTGTELVIYRDLVERFRETLAFEPGSWQTDMPMTVGNRTPNDKPWTGELYLLAMYGRALDYGEIERNYYAGNAF